MRMRILLLLEAVLVFVGGWATLSLPYPTAVSVYSDSFLLGGLALCGGLGVCKAGSRQGLLMVYVSMVLCLICLFFMLVMLVKYGV